eukprot:SAG11_NODE_91_length_17102_cov_37.671343_4_plen_201_part_00
MNYCCLSQISCHAFCCRSLLSASPDHHTFRADGARVGEVKIELQTQDGRGVSDKEEAQILAAWAHHPCSYDDWDDSQCVSLAIQLGQMDTRLQGASLIFGDSGGIDGGADGGADDGADGGPDDGTGGAANAGMERSAQKVRFISAQTLFEEIESLLADWGDRLITIEAVESNGICLQREHPTVCPRLPLHLFGYLRYSQD